MPTWRCSQRCSVCRRHWACSSARATWATPPSWWSISPSGSGWCTRTSSTRWNASMPASEMPSNERTPVLIVGAGPVGLALAGERGVPCVVIEKTDGAIEQARMDMVGPRTMEFCRRWGIAEWVRDAPYPGDYPQDCVYLTALNGYELGRER